MLKQIYEEIKKYNTIVIARHIGVDPDALGSQFALKEAINLNFPDKLVYAVGSKSSRYNYFPKLDRYEMTDNQNVLLIVVDTPDKKRVDINRLDTFPNVCKIDHHPLIDNFGGIEYIDTKASSASELVLRFFKENNVEINKNIAEFLYYGIASDTNRFLFNTDYNTFQIVSDLIKEYDIDVEELYSHLYARPFSEVRFQGYISENLTLTENGFAYVIISNDTLLKYGVDASSAGNMVNNFNNIDEVVAWATISEDVKNGLFKFNIRSRGPVVNNIAERYNGGGHALASGARVKTMEEVQLLINELDNICRVYNEKEGD
ncbi:MAG: bifunctional oligoribonuclease/PAP phosphatase NrnA [Bacilli bacterium]|nr:bifunctional oligoribonuclease/PAP phosphatase NrnA [Bacilli bacterium]